MAVDISHRSDGDRRCRSRDTHESSCTPCPGVGERANRLSEGSQAEALSRGGVRGGLSTYCVLLRSGPTPPARLRSRGELPIKT